MKYIDSKGKPHDTTTMPYPYLCNALKALEGGANARMAADERPTAQQVVDHTVATITEMRAEVARRNMNYALSVPGLADEELARAMTDMTEERRKQPDWTPERQAVYEAVTAEIERRNGSE